MGIPEFTGVLVRKITMESDGLTLWVRSVLSGDEKRYRVNEADELVARLPACLLRDELNDALRVCHRMPGRLANS